MRTEYEIETEINAALTEYRKDPGSLTQDQVAEINGRLKTLRAELQAVLTEGTEPCPHCGSQPIGIHQPMYYEVGCSNPECDRKVKGYSRRANYASKGKTIGEAVAKWNAGEYFLRPETAATVTRAQ